ncbi:FKBP-type peptidyl-prolyl cis-trans isomerase [Paracrocinitomix mangrovi]|uniref:FKBP-type peptidyl-prolyl cis-trans isomerase n=1 Tax=Paracrocinitomix mangrovi TaxID=2862509 RepID=UPI001C8E2AC8|nr:FKBP-type peptidyl-prolyl cis-trans isomerase [Paracrocinitomix mangrovi]UKN03002.1 FKBP-type peptidyl-prolyl cis-trans isomerase [Paracrocinitomix mangrovi]
MNRFLTFLTTTLVASSILSCGGDTDQKDPNENQQHSENILFEFDTYNQKISYCIGLDHARGSFNAYTDKRVQDLFDLGQIRNGMIDYLAGNELQIDFMIKDSLLDLYLMENGDVNTEAVSMRDASYCIGMDEAFMLVSSLVGRKIDQDVDVEYLIKGVDEGFSGTNTPSIPYMDAKKEIEKYYGDINIKNGESFMAENRTIQGIYETESGLQYEIIQEGKGISPNLTDSVMVHYTGRFIDGRVFESTIPSNIPYQGSMMNVIDGWQEGLMMMKEGGQRRLYIPPSLAYGEKGKGSIEPNATLIFDIELLSVKPFQQ